MTGDGLADLVAWEPGADPVTDTGRVKLWVNVNGHTFRCASPATQCTVATLPANFGGPHSPSVTFADFDGNGVEDIVLSVTSPRFTTPS